MGYDVIKKVVLVVVLTSPVTGLLDWKQGKKHEAMYKFEKAFKYAPYNPYTLRTYR